MADNLNVELWERMFAYVHTYVMDSSDTGAVGIDYRYVIQIYQDVVTVFTSMNGSFFRDDKISISMGPIYFILTSARIPTNQRDDTQRITNTVIGHVDPDSLDMSSID